jgi:ribulose-phosphate 3-epimerase
MRFNRVMNRRQKFLELQSPGPWILPSLLLCDFANLEHEVCELEAADVKALHLDVMDGVFVPNFSYGLTIVRAIRGVTELPLDTHLMMVHPEKYIEQFAEAGADSITVHAEAVDDLSAVLTQIRRCGAAAGVAINPGTPVTKIEAGIANADLVLVMSVNAGFGGQSFDETVLCKFEQIRELPGGHDVLLQVDGGVNEQTIELAAGARPHLLVVGSAIFGQPDYSTAISLLYRQLNAINEHI